MLIGVVMRAVGIHFCMPLGLDDFAYQNRLSKPFVSFFAGEDGY